MLDKIRLVQRVGELLVQFPPANLDFNCNCHGASLYVSGLIDDFGWFTASDLVEWMELCKSVDDVKEGNIIIFRNCVKEILHSGIVYEAVEDPMIFSKHKNYHCDVVPLSELIGTYDSNISYFRLDSD